MINSFAFAHSSYCSRNIKSIVELKEINKNTSAEDLNIAGEMYHFGCGVE